MTGPIRVVTLSGSLQERSANGALLRAARTQAPNGIALVPSGPLDGLPYLSSELEHDGREPPAAVVALRALVGAADGVLIASPEHGHSMPGVLKNALDWLVGSGELSGLPVGLVSASPTPGGGIRARMALTQTLLAQAALVVMTLTVPGVKTRLDAAGELVDPTTLRRIRETLVALGDAVAERRAVLRILGRSSGGPGG